MVTVYNHQISSTEWHVCLDHNDLPMYITFGNNGDVYTRTAGEHYVNIKIGSWTEYYPCEYSHLQYAKVTIDPGWIEYWTGLLF